LDLTVESSIEVMLPFPKLFSFSFAPTEAYLQILDTKRKLQAFFVLPFFPVSVQVTQLQG